MHDEPVPDDVYLATSLELLEQRAEALAEGGEHAALLELIATVRRHAAAMREHLRDAGSDELEARIQALVDRADALEQRERELYEPEEPPAEDVAERQAEPDAEAEAVFAHTCAPAEPVAADAPVEAHEPEPEPVETRATHLLFVAGVEGYDLVEREGPCPARGEVVVLGERELLVAKVAPSPLPGDERACAYLL
jgi:hypothetical protein